jgi:carbamoyl-phosphate synthase large subunit
VILASGPNRIGQGLEFDTCCTLASVSYRKHGKKTIVINSNPETLSTDYNISDRLYLEPLNYENVREIMRKEKVTDVVVQLGGQTPLNMAEALETGGFNIIGTPVKAIHDTEDRGLFADLIRRLGLRQPENRMAANAQEVHKHVKEIVFPSFCGRVLSSVDDPCLSLIAKRSWKSSCKKGWKCPPQGRSWWTNS